MTPTAEPANEDARLSLIDREYKDRMCDFGEDLRKLLDPIWNEYFHREWALDKTDERRIG
jgi:hypothetical protein